MADSLRHICLWVIGVILTTQTGKYICQAVWTDGTTFYTIHTSARTWNEAREVCRDSGRKLLTVPDVTAGEMWQNVIASYSNRGQLIASTFWFGLHALYDTSGNRQSHWDQCSIPGYTDPLVEGPSEGECITLTCTGTSSCTWLTGTPCNQQHPFICMEEQSGDHGACLSVCEGLFHFTTQDTCTAACQTGNCTAIYFDQTGMCHHVTAVSDGDDVITVCYIPSADQQSENMCTEKEPLPEVNTTDLNANVTDRSCSEQGTSVEPTQLTTTTTTDMTSGENCTCLCQQLWTFMALPQPEVVNLTVEEKIEIIVQELTVERKNTSLSLRKMISVRDDRVSSVGIGAVAGGIIFSVFALIVVIDLSTVWFHVKTLLRRFLLVLKGYRIEHKDPVAALAQASSSFSMSLFSIAAPPPGQKVSSRPDPTRSVRRTMGLDTSDLQNRNAAAMMKRSMALESNQRMARSSRHAEPSVRRMLQLDTFFAYVGRGNGAAPLETKLKKY